MAKTDSGEGKLLSLVETFKERKTKKKSIRQKRKEKMD